MFKIDQMRAKRAAKFAMTVNIKCRNDQIPPRTRRKQGETVKHCVLFSKSALSPRKFTIFIRIICLKNIISEQLVRGTFEVDETPCQLQLVYFLLRKSVAVPL